MSELDKIYLLCQDHRIGNIDNYSKIVAITLEQLYSLMSGGGGSETLVAWMEGNTDQTMIQNTSTTIILDSGSGTGVNTSTYTYTVPTTGVYKFSYHVITSSTNGTGVFDLNINGSQNRTRIDSNSTSRLISSKIITKYLVQNDVIQLIGGKQGSNAVTINGANLVISYLGIP